jgi:hypothetical protein
LDRKPEAAMFQNFIRLLVGTTAILAGFSIIPMLSHRVEAQQPGFNGQFRAPGFQAAPIPAALRPTDFNVNPGLMMGGMMGMGGKMGFSGTPAL